MSTKSYPTPVPENWKTDCVSCNWWLETYEREDLHLYFDFFYRNEHVLNYYGAKTKEDKAKLSLEL